MARDYDHILNSNQYILLCSGYNAAYTYYYAMALKGNMQYYMYAGSYISITANSATQTIAATRKAKNLCIMADSQSLYQATAFSNGDCQRDMQDTKATVVNNYTVCFIEEDDAITAFLFNTGWYKTAINDVEEGAYYIQFTDNSGATQKVLLSEKVNANVVYYKQTGLNINLSKNVTVTKEELPTVTITDNVDNTTATGTATGANSGTIVLTADSGYKIDNAAVSYMNTSGYAASANMQVSEDGQTATWTGTDIDFTTALTITGSASPQSVTPTFTNNIPHSSYTYAGSNHQYTVNLQADDGYLFDGTPEATYTGYSSDSGVSVSFAVSSDRKTASAVLPDVDENTPIVLSGSTVEETAINVVNNISGTTETHTYDGNTLSVVVSGTAGHYRFKNPQISYTDSEGNEQTADLSVSMVDNVPTASATIEGVKNGSTATIGGTFEYATYVYESLSNCALSEPLPEYVFEGDSVTANLTVNENTLFEDAPVFQYFTSGEFPATQEMTVSTDKTTAQGTFTIPTDYNLQTLTISATATPQTVVGENYGAINVYKVDKDSLQAFSRKRFFKETSTDGTVTAINLGDYVNRIKRIFLDIPASSTDVIKCGNYNTGVECYAPESDEITVNFGSVTLPTPNGDNTDYESDFELFVPFKGFVTVPSAYAGKEISLEYEVNIITGGGVAKLKCGDDVFSVEDVEPSQDVLYRTANENVNLIGGEKWNESVLYGLEPFARVMYYDSLNKDEVNADCRAVNLADLSGFAAVDDVELDTTDAMTIDEQENILKLLQSGVYF